MPDDVRLIADGRNQPKGDYEVGKNRPPKHTQWKKGQSGNPKGRRRLSSNLAECSKEVLREVVPILIRGKLVRMTVAKAIAYKAGIDAAGGDARARNFLAEHSKVEAKEGWTHIVCAPVFEEEENRYLKTFKENERLQERIKYLEGRLNLEPDQ